MLCTLRCYFLRLLSVCFLSNWFYPYKNSAIIIAAVGVYASQWKAAEVLWRARPLCEIVMRQLLLKQTVIYQSFESSRHIHMPVQPCSHTLFYTISLINACNRQLLQSFPDLSQTEGVASCHGILCFVLFFLNLLTCLFPHSICSLFLCLSFVCSLITVVIITRRPVPRAFLWTGMTHTEPLLSSRDD